MTRASFGRAAGFGASGLEVLAFGFWSGMVMVMTEKPMPLKNNPPAPSAVEKDVVKTELVKQKSGESGGQAGPEPTRYGDWEKGGRCTDF